MYCLLVHNRLLLRSHLGPRPILDADKMTDVRTWPADDICEFPGCKEFRAKDGGLHESIFCRHHRDLQKAKNEKLMEKNRARAMRKAMEGVDRELKN